MSEVDPARQRYFAIVLARMGSVVIALTGLVVIGRSVTPLGNLAGVAVVIAGLVLMATGPRALARRWRSPQP